MKFQIVHRKGVGRNHSLLVRVLRQDWNVCGVLHLANDEWEAFRGLVTECHEIEVVDEPLSAKATAHPTR